MLSPAAYNRKVGLAIFCPITNQIKGYPFEVVIPTNSHQSNISKELLIRVLRQAGIDKEEWEKL